MSLLPDYLWGIETRDGLHSELILVRLPDYLWGIETEEWKEQRRKGIGLPDYLWGIETRDWNCGKKQICLGFQTTYEELKPSASSLSAKNLRRFQTTYEELKPFLWIVEVHQGFASRLPMRNWNLAALIDSQTFDRGFQTTYEELKQTVWLFARWSWSWLPDYLWGIETLFTGSGVSKNTALPDYLWGIETGRPAITKERGSTLPDYLWGIETLRLPEAPGSSAPLPDYLWGIETRQVWMKVSGSDRLPDYLWGIETEEWKEQRRKGIGLPDYLWGIETRDWNCGKKQICLGFQTTYEELKPRLPLLCLTSLLASRLPMRNWNTPLLRERGFSYSFQTTYEELKLAHLEILCFFWKCFQTTYEELKQWNRKWSDFTKMGFQTTYEELKLWRPTLRSRATFIASRLPMRNWNSEIWNYANSRIKLPDYLWGIETRLSAALGIAVSGFQTTYEELKLWISSGTAS